MELTYDKLHSTELLLEVKVTYFSLVLIQLLFIVCHLIFQISYTTLNGLNGIVQL